MDFFPAAPKAPTVRTQNKLIRALEKEGLVFTSTGIEERNPIFFVEGSTHEEAYLKLLKDAFDHLHSHKNKELLIMYGDDRVSPPSVNALYREMRAAGITMRQMIEEGNTYIIGPLEEYRCIPKDKFINRVTLIYGDRTASETASVLRGAIRIDKVQAEIQRNTFEVLWSVLNQPTKTTADERF